MIWAQILWGLFLAGLLGFSFHRAWRWEHGAEGDVLFAEKYGKQTYVFVPPTILFWILLVFLGMFVLRFGAREGLVRFAALTADVLLILCVYYVLLLILLPLLRRWFSARACAVLWLVPAFLSWQANVLLSTLPLPRWTIYIPRRVMSVLIAVWIAGSFTVAEYYLISHLVFRKWVRNHTYVVLDAAVCSLWDRERESLDYRWPVALLRGPVDAPFSMGSTKRSRCTVLPERDYAPEELSMIFRHELHHLQRGDVDTKAFLCLCNALCWFNPLVWIATRKAAEDLERSCDEIVTEDMEETERKAYAHLLLEAAAPGRGCTTCLSAAVGTLRYRLKGVMDRRRRLLGTLLLMAALFGCVMCFGVFSLCDARGSVSELLLSDGTEITYVSNHSHPFGMEWDDAAMRAAIGGIELEHIAGLRNPVLDGKRITFLLSGGRIATLTERIFIVNGFNHDMNTADCYLVKSAVDFDAIRAALEAG